MPVRVIRGSKLRSAFAPATGYRYDGLYFVESNWQAKGKSGFRIWRYRLLRDDVVPPPWVSPPASTPIPPPRVSTTVQRIVRNTRIAQEVKELHAYHCQVCGVRLETPTGPYAEAAHIRPLGAPHSGPDVHGNILCVCPNHHVLFDDGALMVEDDLTCVGAAGGMLRTVSSHKLDVQYLAYHRRHFSIPVAP